MDSFKLENSPITSCFLAKGLRAIATLAVSLNIFLAPVLIAYSEVEFDAIEFFKHGKEHAHFFFSLWVWVFEIIYFNIYFILDLMEIFGKQNASRRSVLIQKLHTLASYMLFALVFPLSLLILIVFWPVYTWNRELIYPSLLDKVFLTQMNHTMHTYPPFFALLYMLITNEYEPSKKKAFTVLLGLIAVYSGILVTIKIRRGKWVYLFLEYLTPIQLSCFFPFCIFGSIAFFFLGYYLNSKIKVFRAKINAELKKNL